MEDRTQHLDQQPLYLHLRANMMGVCNLQCTDAVHTLQHQAFELLGWSQKLEQWKNEMIEKSPTFQYWNSILSIEMLVLFVRAHREKNFPLYVEVLESIVGYFFVFDHNYARWASAHIHDMSSIPDSIKQEFLNSRVVSKTQHRFSSIPIDQAHEQQKLW